MEKLNIPWEDVEYDITPMPEDVGEERQHLDDINHILDVFHNLEKRYNALKALAQYYDDVQADEAHDFENISFNACEGYIMAKEFQEMRIARRKVKNELALIEPLFKWYKEHKNIEPSLNSAKAKMVNIKSEQDNWFYRRKIVKQSKINRRLKYEANHLR